MALSNDGIALRLKDADNVAVCLRAIDAGREVRFDDCGVRALAPIPAGHKIGLRAIEAGEFIVKYGEHIGRASSAIAAGAHVHVHNVEGVRGRGDLAEVKS